MSGAGPALRALRLGARLGRKNGLAAGRTPGIRVERRRSRGGTAVESYRGPGGVRRTWVVVHGFTVNGGREPRLVAFAETLAAEGLACVVPTLPGLSSMRLDPGDVDGLCDAVAAAADETGGPVGIVGFSVGGSLALLAAARADAGCLVRRVVAFGACHRLEPLLAACVSDARRTADRDADVERALFAWEVLILGGHAVAPFGPDVVAKLRDLAARDCEGALVAEKRAFFERHLRGLSPEGLSQPPADVLRRLSPADNLAGVRCPVTLVHDPCDPDVPVSHAEAIFRELRPAAAGASHRLLRTSLIAHVSPAPALHPVAAVRFVSALADFFR